MTMYILAGGGDYDYPEYMLQLSRVVHSKITKPKILSCGFSSDNAKARQRFPKHVQLFKEKFGDLAEFIMATKDDFVEQVRVADVVYFHGGSTNVLVDAMKAYPGVKQEFEGKIIIGSSAGANYLSSCGFSPSINDIGQHGGIVDVAVVVHYGSPGFNDMTFESGYWERAARAVRKASGKNEVILLPEGTFVVIEQ